MIEAVVSVFVTLRRFCSRALLAGPRSEWREERRFIVASAMPGIFLVVAVSFYPILSAGWVSMHQTRYLRLERFVGLDNYLDLLRDPAFRETFVNTLVYVLSSLVVTVPLGLGLALLLNSHLPFTGAFRAILIAPWVVSHPVAALLWLWVLEPSMGPASYLLDLAGHARIYFLADPTLAMVTVITANIWISYPFPMILFLAALKTVPEELREAAQVDGAGRWATFRYAEFPFLRSTLLSTMVLVGMLYGNMVALIYLMTGGGPLIATQTLAVVAFKQSFMQFKIGLGATTGVLILLMNIILGVCYIRLLRHSGEETVA